MKKRSFFLLITVLLLTVGCTHSLRLTNDELKPPSQAAPMKPIKIGFINSNDILINAAIEETALKTMVKEAKKDYKLDSAIEVDYVVELTNSINYSASGQNFPITIPGFLLFTHAWLGYKYYADISTQSKLFDPKGNLLNEQKMETPYEFRYTSFARGAASSLVGWFTPGWGLLDIIPGIIFATSYDDRANGELFEKVKPSYKAFVSSKVLEQIAIQQNSSVAPNLKASVKTEKVVADNEPPGQMPAGTKKD